ncbi:RNA cap guanine-N2 methyltransferase-domain-containing protein [Hygrophoropsis aurantiaca]|uniref:RNA cap guanine-N2 methyltransferase-domain-containing protein n=1 Tax=Hygrophoropsis aurantiaca TaxID=72124 RepID=A0ACB7ZTA2_9AGAM|nr:RNA cap guanine-N2 methyltransferase-domain-containing protein [Hygrophoropsis aurantiaca]
MSSSLVAGSWISSNFSLYDEGCLLDEEGWYSVTLERIAHQIAERCRCDTILDAFCGVGGNAIAFAKTCERVIALDTSPIRLALARHNAVIYGVADRIEFILADYISFAHSHLSRPQKGRPIDVVFLSPPWGGPSYISPSAELLEKNEVNSTEDVTTEVSSHPEYSLSSIKPIHGAQLFHLSRKITSNVAYYLPRHTNLEEISSLLTSSPGTDASNTEVDPPQMVEVEEEWMGLKLKALTCYFGGLDFLEIFDEILLHFHYSREDGAALVALACTCLAFQEPVPHDRPPSIPRSHARPIYAPNKDYCDPKTSASRFYGLDLGDSSWRKLGIPPISTPVFPCLDALTWIDLRPSNLPFLSHLMRPRLHYLDLG